MASTRLDAINVCLRGIGLAPVTEDDQDLDAADAGEIVDQISEQVQTRGWWFNREQNWMLTPDATTGVVGFPSGALGMIAVNYTNLVKRGTRVYDIWEHSYDLKPYVNGSGKIEFVFIMNLEFNDMPQEAKTAISYIARRMFAQDKEVDERRWNFQKQDEITAMTALERKEASTKRRNYLRDNPRTANALSRIGGYNGYSNNLVNFPKRCQQEGC